MVMADEEALAQPTGAHGPASGRVNFEIVGADNMLDTNYNAWLLEINTGPVVKEGDFEMIRGIVGFFYGGGSDKPA